MPGITKRIAQPNVGNEVLTILLLAGSIAAIMCVVYFFQGLSYSSGPMHRSNAKISKITAFTHDDVYDLSGSEASGAGDPMRLFDENADPANGPRTDPKTDPLPNPSLLSMYPPGRGLRIVVDLHDLYSITDLYLYDRSPGVDSVWLYTGDMHHWNLAATYVTTGNPAGWGWKNFTAHSDSRYVMIRFNSPRATVSELVMYGTVKTKLPPDHIVALPRLAAPTLAAFAGTNSYDWVAPALLQPFGQIRFYQMMDWYDTDTVHAYPKNELSANVFHLPPNQQWANYADSLHKQGSGLWLSIRGLPRWMMQKGFNEKDKPVTKPGMDTEDPLSYGRHARTFWNLAAMFGSAKKDSAKLAITDMPRRTGLGAFNRFENGNEEDGYWTKYYWTPMDYFAVSSADYDGHEGRLGAQHGLAVADANCKLMTSGMIQLDTNRVRTLAFICRQMRRDKKFIWQGGVQYHYYSNDATDHLKPPTLGVSPEQDHLREKLAKVRAFHDRMLPGIPLILGENGYDRNRNSWQKTPLLPGRSEAESQGIMIIRSLIAAFMSGFDGYNQFMIRNATAQDDIPGVYATTGLIGGPGSNTIYPGWYYWSTTIHYLGDYLPDGIVSESGPVWIYRFRHRANANKKAFILVSPTVDGSIVNNFSFKPGGFQNQSITRIELQDKNPLGQSTHEHFTSGVATLRITESPTILLVD